MQQRKRMARWIAAMALTACLDVAIPAAPAAEAPPTRPALDTGTLRGAPYRIDVPPHWNGDLVMLMHGYEPQGAPRGTPMQPKEPTQLFLDQGYAVAQSGYASQGWAVGDAIVDTERLRQRAVRQFGHLRHIYLVGMSLGGLEAAASLERYRTPTRAR